MFENSLNNQSCAESLSGLAQLDKANPENKGSVWMDDLFQESRDRKVQSGFNSMLLVCEIDNNKTEKVQSAETYDFEKARVKSGKTHCDNSKTMVDHFESLDELKKDLKYGTDYTIESKDRKSPITVVAPHGGYIEPGSSELANAIAGKDFNLYDFKGLDNEHPRKAHITSAKFKDPQLSKLLDSSDLCISLHGMRGDEKAVFIGGLNKQLRSLVAKNLKEAGFPVDANPPRFKGEHRNNFVNQPEDHGVQLELSWGIRKEIMSDKISETGKTSKFDTFVNAVRKAIVEYQEQKQP